MSKTAIASPELSPPVRRFPRRSKSVVSSTSADRSAKTRPLARWSKWLSLCVAASLLSLNARAQDVRQYTDGPVTEVVYIQVEYGHFEEYIDWLNSTWKPTMEAWKKAGLIIDYKVFQLTPKSPDQPNMILWKTYKNAAAALDNGVAIEEVTKKAAGSTQVQNKASAGRNEYRKVLGTEYIRELILK